MNLYEYLFSLSLATWIVYQHIMWRTRVADVRGMYVARLEVETAMAYRQGLAEGELRAGRLKTFTFKRYETIGVFRKHLVEFSIKLTYIGSEIMNADGDFKNIDKFEIPDDLKKLILAAPKVAAIAAKTYAATHGIPPIA
jgi:hypothetical protein